MTEVEHLKYTPKCSTMSTSRSKMRLHLKDSRNLLTEAFTAKRKPLYDCSVVCLKLMAGNIKFPSLSTDASSDV